MRLFSGSDVGLFNCIAMLKFQLHLSERVISLDLQCTTFDQH
jgi:hypothetical protein